MKEITQLTLAQIVNNDFRTSAVFEKYHLDFCCKGKRTLEQACSEQQLLQDEVTADLENSFTNNETKPDFKEMTLTQLCEYIVKTHHAYVKKELPLIHAYLQKVAFKHGERHPEVKNIAELFSTLKEEMENHMQKEEIILFPRIKELQKLVKHKTDILQINIDYLQFPITVMEHEHDHAGNLMNEIRMLSNDYNPPIDACTTFRLSYAVLQAFELDLHQHVHLENNILFPEAISLIKNLKGSDLN